MSLGQPAGALFPQTMMEDSILLLGAFRKGQVVGKLWRVAEFDVGGNLKGADLMLELVNGPPVGNVSISFSDLPDLASVLVEALAFAKQFADQSIKAMRLPPATPDAGSSGSQAS